MAILIETRRTVRDATGAPYVGALLNVYKAGGLVPADLFADDSLDPGAPLTNPVVADSNGRFPQVFVATDSFDVVLTTAGGVEIESEVDVVGVGEGASTISKDFLNSRFRVSGTAGVVNVEFRPPSGDNSGGSGRLGGSDGTQADDIEIDAAQTSVTGDMTVDGLIIATGGVQLSDGSIVANAVGLISETGKYYPADSMLETTDNNAFAAGRIYWLPFSRGIVADVIAFSNTGIAGNARVGLYAADPTTGLPGALIQAPAAISLASGGVKAVALSPNYTVSSRVWVAYLMDVGATMSGGPSSAFTRLDGRQFGQTTIGTPVFGFYSTFPYAALPATAPAITGTLTSIPALALRSV